MEEAMSSILNKSPGATELRFLDVLTALILLAILLYASYKQFPAYRAGDRPAPSMRSSASPSPK